MSSDLNYGRALRLSAMKFGERVFLEHGGALYTFREFNRQVNAVAAWLQALGMRHLDRMVLVSANSPDYLRLLFAAAKLGITTVPASSLLRPNDLTTLLKAARPSLAVTSSSYTEVLQLAIGGLDAPSRPSLLTIGTDAFRSEADSTMWPALFEPGAVAEPVPDGELDDDDPATVLFTSGSSGTPKGVMKSYANLMWHAINRQLAEPRHEGDRELFVLPLTGIGFANFVLTDALTGATCVLESFDAGRALELLANGGITHAFLAPTMLMAIERERPGVSFPSVGVLETAYEIPLSQREIVVRQFPDAKILYSYGLSEGSMARSPANRFLSDLTCVGYASGLDEYRVRDVVGAPEGMGEILVAGPSVMSGYFGVEDKALPSPFEDDWLRTGDLGWIDDYGACHFGGRAKELIKSGGTSIFASDIESVLVEHPGIDCVAVVGVPDEYWGEAVVAVLEVSDNALTVADVRAFAEHRLSRYQLPKAYYVLPRVPLNHTGKIAKGEVRKLLASGTLTAMP